MMTIRELIKSLKSIESNEIDFDDALSEIDVAALIREVLAARGTLAADEMPPDDMWSVDVYMQSHSNMSRAGRWVSWPVDGLKPWHIWRPLQRAVEKSMTDKSRRIRKIEDVIALDGNGFYMRRSEAVRNEKR